MKKQAGQTFLNPARTHIAEITGITKTGRIKFVTYWNGEKRSGGTLGESHFNTLYPIFVANP